MLPAHSHTLHALGHAGIAAHSERHLDDMRLYPMSEHVVLRPHRASGNLGYKLEYPHSKKQRLDHANIELLQISYSQ